MVMCDIDYLCIFLFSFLLIVVDMFMMIIPAYLILFLSFSDSPDEETQTFIGIFDGIF